MGDRQSADTHPSLPFDDVTYSVSALCSEVRDLLRATPSRWVAGEVQRARKSRAGHLYFELVEKGEGDTVVGKLEAVIWRRDARIIESRLARDGQEIADGLEIRCLGDLDFYPPFGRLQLAVRDVDAVFMLGQLARRRKATLEALSRAGLIDSNGQLELSEVALDLALVTSDGSAAYHDFISTLGDSGLGFRVFFIHASVQGQSAEREISSAIAAAGRLAVACSVLIRGGGSKTDLAAFDSRLVAEAVARSPVPVITGLGHDTDQAIADRVAHTRARTPTQAAELLVQRARGAERAVHDQARRLALTAARTLEGAQRTVQGMESGVQVAAARLDSERHRLIRLRDLLGRAARSRIGIEGPQVRAVAARLSVAAPIVLGRREAIAESLVERLASSVRQCVGRARREIESLERLCNQLGPERTLARGFSITRDARGRVVTARRQLNVDDRLRTELADGVVVSRVEE